MGFPRSVAVRSGATERPSGLYVVTLPPTFIQRERGSGFEFVRLGGLGNGGWRRAVQVAQRQAPLRGEGPGELGRRLSAEAGVRAFGVAVLAPGRERDAGAVQGRKHRLVQEPVAQAAIEALAEGVPGRLARRDTEPSRRH